MDSPASPSGSDLEEFKRKLACAMDAGKVDVSRKILEDWQTALKSQTKQLRSQGEKTALIHTDKTALIHTEETAIRHQSEQKIACPVSSCKRDVWNLPRHLILAHKWSQVDARAARSRLLLRKQRYLPHGTPKRIRRRTICPLSNCKKLLVNLSYHLQTQHNLTDRKDIQLCQRASKNGQVINKPSDYLGSVSVDNLHTFPVITETLKTKEKGIQVDSELPLPDTLQPLVENFSRFMTHFFMNFLSAYGSHAQTNCKETKNKASNDQTPTVLPQASKETPSYLTREVKKNPQTLEDALSQAKRSASVSQDRQEKVKNLAIESAHGQKADDASSDHRKLQWRATACPVPGCGKSIVELPRHLVSVHKWNRVDATAARSRFHLKKRKKETSEQTRKRWDSLVCPFSNCKRLLNRLGNHLRRNHKISREDIERCLRAARRGQVIENISDIVDDVGEDPPQSDNNVESSQDVAEKTSMSSRDDELVQVVEPSKQACLDSSLLGIALSQSHNDQRGTERRSSSIMGGISPHCSCSQNMNTLDATNALATALSQTLYSVMHNRVGNFSDSDKTTHSSSKPCRKDIGNTNNDNGDHDKGETTSCDPQECFSDLRKELSLLTERKRDSRGKLIKAGRKGHEKPLICPFFYMKK